MAFCMKKDEDHLPGRISISIAWLMAGGPPGTCLRLPVRVRTCLRATHRQAQTGAVTHTQARDIPRRSPPDYSGSFSF